MPKNKFPRKEIWNYGILQKKFPLIIPVYTDYIVTERVNKNEYYY